MFRVPLRRPTPTPTPAHRRPWPNGSLTVGVPLGRASPGEKTHRWVTPVGPSVQGVKNKFFSPRGERGIAYSSPLRRRAQRLR